MRAFVAAVAIAACSREERVQPDRTRKLPPEPSWSAVPAPPRPEPPPSPSPSVVVVPPFDRDAARRSLAAVDTKACKLRTSARVIVRFVPSGKAIIDKVGTEDPLPSTIELCVIAAFEKATVPEFSGPDVTVAVLAR